MVSEAARVHELKTLRPYFQAVLDGRKRFEVRKDDRGYQTGDILCLNEIGADRMLTGRLIEMRVTYILREATHFGVVPGYVVLGIEPGAQAPQPAVPDDILRAALRSLIRDLRNDLHSVYWCGSEMWEACKDELAQAVAAWERAFPGESHGVDLEHGPARPEVPPDLLRSCLRVVAWIDPWSIGHALRYPESAGRPHAELYAAGVEIQARARAALRMMDEEAKAGE